MEKRISFRAPDIMISRYEEFIESTGLSGADVARIAFDRGLTDLEKKGISSKQAQDTPAMHQPRGRA